LVSKFWALGGVNQKSKKMFYRAGHGEMTARKWFDFDSIEKQKRRSNLKFVTDRRTYRQSQQQK